MSTDAIRAPSVAGPWMTDRTRDRLLGFASPIGLLLVWEIGARTGLIDTRFFPAPSSIIAIIMGLSRPVRALFEPLIAATYPIPKSSILPLALLIFGLGEGSKIFMVAVGVFFPVAINATTGVLEINKIYLDVGANYKASRWNMFRTIALPGALPVIMTGIRLGLGMGLVLIAVAEMIGAKSGLGYIIWSAWETFAVEQMYVGLFVIAIIGSVLTIALNEVEKILVPWRN
jgi:ABC-type nitrate/sulfonate/bicarbonate transport system permease component